MALYLLHEAVLICDGKILFQYLKTVLKMQDSALSETEMKMNYTYVRARGSPKQRRINLLCAASSLRLRFLLSKENFDVKL